MTVLESHGYPTVYKFFDGLMSDIVNDMDMDMKRFDWRGNQNTTIQSIYSFILDILLIYYPLCAILANIMRWELSETSKINLD